MQEYFAFFDESGAFDTPAYPRPAASEGSGPEHGACVAGLLFPRGCLPPKQLGLALEGALPRRAAFLHVAEFLTLTAHVVWSLASQELEGTPLPVDVATVARWVQHGATGQIELGGGRAVAVPDALRDEVDRAKANPPEPLRIGVLRQLDRKLRAGCGARLKGNGPLRRSVRRLEAQVGERLTRIRLTVETACRGGQACLIAATHPEAPRSTVHALPRDFEDRYLEGLGAVLERACLLLFDRHRTASTAKALPRGAVRMIPQAASRRVATNTGPSRLLTGGVLAWLRNRIQRYEVHVETREPGVEAVAHMDRAADPALQIADFLANRLRRVLAQDDGTRTLAELDRLARTDIALSLMPAPKRPGVAATGEPRQALLERIPEVIQQGTSRPVAATTPLARWSVDQANLWLEALGEPR